LGSKTDSASAVPEGVISCAAIRSPRPDSNKRQTGGNFGVVTSFEYQLHPVKDIVAGIFFYPIDKVREVFSFYRDYVATAPEQLGLLPGIPDRAAAALHPGEGSREAVLRDRGLLGRVTRQG
jgi:FAD/FMN-containing dehydrogenase